MITVETKIGNTSIRVHSPSGVNAMQPEQRREWFKNEWEKGNPVVRSIADFHFKMQRKIANRTA